MSEQEQKFVYDLAKDAKFGTGLRDYFEYRDFGFAKGSKGLVQAHVLRAAKPCPPGGMGRHIHTLQFQMNYILKGWMKFELEGEVHTFHAGDAWMQPPDLKHELLEYSDDLENIEVVMPANFGTEEV